MSTIHRSYLRRVRKKSGLTQADMALLLGVKRASVISKIETRRNDISAQALLAYCIIFECSPEDLLPELILHITRTTKANAIALLNMKEAGLSPLTKRRTEILQAIVHKEGTNPHV